MKFEQPPMPSPEEMAKIEKERILSDAELLKGGADYKFDEKGQKRLDVTDEQIEEAREEMKTALQNREQVEKVEKELKSNFTQEFFERHKDFAERLKDKNKEVAEEMYPRLFVLKDLREEFANFGFQELGKPTYKENNDNASDIKLKIDTLNLGIFEIDLKLKGPEIVIKVDTDVPSEELKLPKELHQLFNNLKEKGLFITPIFLVGKEEMHSFGSPEIPSKLPPSAREISEEEWRKINEREALRKSSLTEYPKEIREELLERFWNWPRLGARGRTEYGIINGALIFCDGKKAIFDILPQGKMEIPFGELLDPFGYDYAGERKRREQKEKQRPIEEPPTAKFFSK